MAVANIITHRIMRAEKSCAQEAPLLDDRCQSLFLEHLYHTIAKMSKPPRDGLAWEDGSFKMEPRSTREPSVTAIEKICREQRSQTATDTGTNGSDQDDDEELDNEGKTELYRIHLIGFEQTQLRKVYAARMQQSHPDWATRVEDGFLEMDFLEAVHRCRGGFHLRRISQRADAVMEARLSILLAPPRHVQTHIQSNYRLSALEAF
ncbi:hypothetical protein LY76DRAFT_609734 [Colletotrichum caudatum]|nr:hypothetical protein LY76DRAFT_609734 [Colletotrichum caudatum]